MLCYVVVLVADNVVTMEELAAQREKRKASKLKDTLTIPLDISHMPLSMAFNVRCKVVGDDMEVKIKPMRNSPEYDGLQLATAIWYAQAMMIRLLNEE